VGTGYSLPHSLNLKAFPPLEARLFGQSEMDNHQSPVINLMPQIKVQSSKFEVQGSCPFPIQVTPGSEVCALNTYSAPTDNALPHRRPVLSLSKDTDHRLLTY